MLGNTQVFAWFCVPQTVVGESLNESWDKEVDGGVPQSAREAQGESRQQFSIKFWPLGPSWGHFGAHFGVVWRLLEAFETQMARERRLEEVLGHSGDPLRAIMGPCWDQLGSSWGHLGVILGLPGAVWVHLGAILGLSCGHAILAPTWRHLGLSSSLLPSSFMHSCPPTLRYACFRQSIRFPQSTLHTSSWLSLMQDTGRWKLRLTELTHCFDSVR